MLVTDPNAKGWVYQDYVLVEYLETEFMKLALLVRAFLFM